LPILTAISQWGDDFFVQGFFETHIPPDCTAGQSAVNLYLLPGRAGLYLVFTAYRLRVAAPFLLAARAGTGVSIHPVSGRICLGGRYLRSLHRLSSHLFLVLIFLHTLRVILTGAYRKPRELNWVIGFSLLCITIFDAYTGYLLPLDQLSLWATQTGMELVGTTFLGPPVRGILVPDGVGQPLSLLRFYILHIVLLPLSVLSLSGLHFYRIRKDRGKKLLERLSCRRCHRYEEKGNRLAGSLDVTGATGKARDIYESIRAPVLFMPNFHASDVQIADLVNAILARVKFAKPPTGETALAVHFQDVKNIRKNVFAGQCGKCHKILSERAGGLGSGYIGPNLSGLFSEFYPRTYRDAESWNPDRLKKWLENPRDIRINAMMPPVRLAPEEFEQLLGIIQLDKSSPDAPR